MSQQRSRRGRGVVRDGVSLGTAVGLHGVAFGATATAAGLSVWQASALSLLMFTGASQFALVGVLSAGGGPFGAVGSALLRSAGRPARRLDGRVAETERTSGGRSIRRRTDMSGTTLWAVVIGASIGSYLLKLAGLSVPPRVLERPLIRRAVELIPAALLAALVAVNAFTSEGALVVDFRLAALAAAALALALRASFIVVLLVAGGVGALGSLVAG